MIAAGGNLREIVSVAIPVNVCSLLKEKDRNKTSSHLNQNALTFGSKHQGVLKKHQGLFLKPLDVFVLSSDKTRVGLARRSTRFMLED